MGEAFELRQYTLRPGQRDVLVELFDREFVETQEAEGMAILGQFRDLDRPDRFVWLRGFPDIATRAAALTAFYSGPAWKAHAAAANATMVDIDDVLLLRPVRGFHLFDGTRPPVGAPAPESVVLATIYLRDHPFDDGFSALFARSAGPALAWYRTEYAENDFPALPVRTGVHAFVWFARFDSVEALDEQPAWEPPGVKVHRLRLAPTGRSLLR
jgi:NIPSNAP